MPVTPPSPSPPTASVTSPVTPAVCNCLDCPCPGAPTKAIKHIKYNKKTDIAKKLIFDPTVTDTYGPQSPPAPTELQLHWSRAQLFFIKSKSVYTDGMMSDMEVFQDSAMTQWTDLAQLLQDETRPAMTLCLNDLISAIEDSTDDFCCIEPTPLYLALLSLSNDDITKMFMQTPGTKPKMIDPKTYADLWYKPMDHDLSRQSVQVIKDIDTLYSVIIWLGEAADVMPSKIEMWLEEQERIEDLTPVVNKRKRDDEDESLPVKKSKLALTKKQSLLAISIIAGMAKPSGGHLIIHGSVDDNMEYVKQLQAAFGGISDNETQKTVDQVKNVLSTTRDLETARDLIDKMITE